MNELQMLAGKLDKVAEELQELKIQMAGKIQQEIAHQKNIERFWNANWPDALTKIDRNKDEIARHEIALARLNTKLLIYGSLIATIIPLSMTIFLHYLRQKS